MRRFFRIAGWTVLMLAGTLAALLYALAYPDRVGTVLAIFGGTFVAWMILQDINKAIDRKFYNIKTAVDDLERRLDRIETKLDNLKPARPDEENPFFTVPRQPR